MKSETKRKQSKGNGVSIKNLNYVIGAVTIAVAIVLIVVSYYTFLLHNDVQKTTYDYIIGQNSAYEMQRATDYLTEQVRSYIETGDKVYVDNYFQETEVNHTREESLSELADSFPDSRLYETLQLALQESVILTQREHYAMCLTIYAYSNDMSIYPEKLQEVEISNADMMLTPTEKIDLARYLVFDDEYHKQKELIFKDTQDCVDQLIESIQQHLDSSSDNLSKIVRFEQLLIVILIASVIAIILLTTIQVISPLIRAIPRIRADESIPVSGSSEFRFLATTYNRMYEDNKARKEKLAYEASHDQLTGLLNRNGFKKLVQVIDFSTVALLLIDIDRFKQINDTYGHDVGDQVLTRVAATLTKNFRSYDSLCRIGGDEFALFMYNTASDKKELIANKINTINAELKNTVDGVPGTSVSVGVAFGTDDTDETLFKKADEALYVVKRNGRRGCSFYE